MPKLWMSGVGTLCAIAHYRAALFSVIKKIWKDGKCGVGGILSLVVSGANVECKNVHIIVVYIGQENYHKVSDFSSL